MKIANLFIIFFGIFIPNFMFSQETFQMSTSEEKQVHIVCITIPKSGTHLLYNTIVSLTPNGIFHPQKNGLKKSEIMKIRKLNQKKPPNNYKGFFHIPTVGPLPNYSEKMKDRESPRSFWDHWPYTKQSEILFSKYSKASFFMIRDPRAMLVSMAFMVHKSLDGKEVPVEEVLIDLIDGKQRRYIPWAVEIQTAHPLMWELGVVEFYNLYLPWMKVPNFYTVRFEDLIGEKGGGSKRLQIQTIQDIASHLKMNITSDEAEIISENIFGGTITFRDGQVNSWKKYFTDDIKENFKKVPGACQLLIDLGYEQDCNW